jgi:beta-galactosidase
MNSPYKISQPLSPLGAQMWLEPDDSAARVEMLCSRAVESGLGWIRIFLMWPWIERLPQQWDFTVFDLFFAAAEKHGLKVKATLTANSGPAWLGTPGVLHSFTGLLDPVQRDTVERYIKTCVNRYATHPSLAQWILWNEPSGGGDRTPETLSRWHSFLRERYHGDLAKLNRRWLTAYSSFDEFPFWNEVPHPLHRGSHWATYRPALDDGDFRADWLNHQIGWIADIVRALDPHTELCINPTQVLANQAAGGTDLEGMGRICEVIGASYHPAWQFSPFAQRADYPALMAAGVRHCASHPGVRRVEVTEVQMGNTFQSSNRPNTVHPGELARFFLASFAAGAETVTGWCLNIRRHDNEAGDWSLLDDNDNLNARSRALRRVLEVLASAQVQTGVWRAAPADVWLPLDPRAQALEMVEAPGNIPLPGRRLHDSIFGQSLLAQRLGEMGLASTLVRFAHLPEAPTVPGQTAVVSHVVAWEKPEADRLLAWTEAGGTLVLDGTCGRKNFDATQHQPWPGHLGERIGLIATGHESRAEHYDLTVGGVSGGRWVATRLCAQLSPDCGWNAWPDVLFAVDGEPAVWERTWGKGRIIIARGLLGPSLIDSAVDDAATRTILARATAGRTPLLSPVAGQRGLTTIPIACEHGTLVVALAIEPTDGGIRPMRLQGAPGREWHDFWTGETLTADATGELAIATPDGVAVMWCKCN